MRISFVTTTATAFLAALSCPYSDAVLLAEHTSLAQVIASSPYLPDLLESYDTMTLSQGSDDDSPTSSHIDPHPNYTKKRAYFQVGRDGVSRATTLVARATVYAQRQSYRPPKIYRIVSQSCHSIIRALCSFQFFHHCHLLAYFTIV